MTAILILAGVFVLYEVIQQQNTLAQLLARSAGGQPAQPQLPLPAYQLQAPQQSNAPQTESQAAQGISAGLNFVPVVGPVLSSVFNAIAGGLIKASAQRAAEAKTENAAVAQAVPGWDKAVAQIVAAYNGGQLNASEVQQFLMCPQSNDANVPSGAGLLWKNFWNEVGPQVQPGRNGCQSGTSVQPSSQSYCGGNAYSAGMGYGAGCCVAYDSLKNSSVAILRALNSAELQPGRPQTAATIPVFASKYGGINRPAYNVTLTKPAGSAPLMSFV